MNQLITNTPSSNFYNHITRLLSECDSFIFNVAFINFSGLQLLLDSLEKLEKKGINGKILTSTYLNFTEPKALEYIRKFKNIELKIHTDESVGFHSKSYIFQFKDSYEVIIGSSNITASALKSNIEWNIKTVNKKDDLFMNDIFKEFKTLWTNSDFVSDEFLTSYKTFYDKSKNQNSFKYNSSLKKNKMQEEALSKLEYYRKAKEKKVLAVAATGTGKTYLSAFHIKQCKPKRVLFLVHRENILIKAKHSFESIIDNYTCGLYTGNKKEKNCDYLFCTIQTMSLSFKDFKKDEFDYIVVDEAHHVVSPSYEKVLDYFDYDFLLGLTATPNRMDKLSIYEYFDDNIACDIRLSDALEHSLVAPFHYYGVSDIISVDYTTIDLKKTSELSKLLMVNKRVDYIIEKMNFYGFSGKKRKALGFCSSKEHAKFMCNEFNKRGYNSKYLTSEDTAFKRDETIYELEDENSSLEFIFSVDIFNEGIDIPSINTVLLLRPTNSPIIFIQQLGRGLRKHKSKEFLTLLDFIGNHNKSYLIALALMGNKSIDKESVKLALLNNFANIQNAFIFMDEISKDRILTQIENENFNALKYLKEEYFEFKKELSNKIPKLCDYLVFSELINPLKFISESKSYVEFLNKVEKTEELNVLCLNENFIKAIRFIESLLPIKRVYEFIVLKYLLENKVCDENILYKLLQKYLVNINKDTIKHSLEFLNQNYLDKAQISRYLKLIELREDGTIIKSKEFTSLITQNQFREFIEDSINYGIISYEKSFGLEDYGIPFFKLYEKYNMLNIAQLCNFRKIHSSFRGSGFLKNGNNFFLFITIQKDKISKASKYHNAFLSKDIFTYSSKPSHSQDKGDGLKLITNKQSEVTLHIFVRKFTQVDKKTQSFIYLGLADTFSYEGNKPINLQLKLQVPLNDKLYEEFTKIV